MSKSKIQHINKPKFWRVATSARTIDIQAKEWFDKVNGNSYWSAEVTVNFGLNNTFSFDVGFQYGYGNLRQSSAV